MDKKKIVEFLILRPAFTIRNFTSIGLVLVFFGIYVLAGGKVTLIPKDPTGENFGSVSSAGRPAPVNRISGDVVPVEPARHERMPAGTILGSSSSQSFSSLQNESELKKEAAELSDLEERLKKLQVKKKTGGQ